MKLERFFLTCLLCVASLFSYIAGRSQSPVEPAQSVAMAAPVDVVEQDQEIIHEQQHGIERSSDWPAVRAKHLELHPVCEACGGKGKKGKPLQVHHVIPFGVDGQGDSDSDGITNELDPDNLITLCVDGPCGMNCHFIWGHLAWTKCHNPNVREDAAFFRKRLKERPCP